MRLENLAKILCVDPRDESVGCSVFLKVWCLKMPLFTDVFENLM